MTRGLSVGPLLVGMVLVSGAITALAFAVHGEELARALPFAAFPVSSGFSGPAPASSEPGSRVDRHPTRTPVPVRPTAEPVEVVPRWRAGLVWGPPSDGGPRVDVLVG